MIQLKRMIAERASEIVLELMRDVEVMTICVAAKMSLPGGFRGGCSSDRWSAGAVPCEGVGCEEGRRHVLSCPSSFAAK